MTEDWTPIDFGQTEDTTKNIIKVIGVGGGGCNAVKNMYSEGIVNVSFAVCNTDSQSLSKSPVPVKIMLGKSGLGAGANPEVGRSEAQNTQEDIKRLLDDGTKMAFVTAGMGGGTGTGAAPVIAGIAKSMGILTVGIITIPFYFEKRKKIVKALQGVEEMRKNVDALLIVNNERLCDVYADSEITVKVRGETYVGGKSCVGRNGQGGVATDFLFRDESTQSFAVVDIKTPDNHQERRRCHHGYGQSQRRRQSSECHPQRFGFPIALRQRHQQCPAHPLQHLYLQQAPYLR